MRILVILLLIIWVIVVVPSLMVIFGYYDSMCVAWGRSFDVNECLIIMKNYVPGAYRPFEGAPQTLKGAFGEWSSLLENLPQKYYIFIIVLSFIVICMLFVFENKYRRHRIKKSVAGDFGTAKKATKKEIRKFLGNDGLVLSKRLQLGLKYDYEHVMIMGPIGSGKTRGYTIPNLLQNLPGSIIVTDPKGDLFKYTSAYQESIGKKVFVFAPDNPENSFFYNPLYYCDNDSDTRNLALNILSNGNISAESLTGSKAMDVQWMNMARNLLAAALIWAQRAGKTISEGFDAVIDRDSDELDAFFDKSGYGLRDYRLYRQSLESPKTAASIRTTMASLSQLWIDDKVRMVTSDNEFDFTRIRKEPCIIYVIVPFNKMVYFMQLLSVFFTQVFAAINTEDKNSLPVHFILEEFANIGKIPGIDNYIATCRYNRISLSMVIQNKSQLDSIYGRDTANAMLSSIKTQIALPGLISESAKYFSELAGTTTIESVHASTSRALYKPIMLQSHHGEGFARHARALYTPDEIRRMPDGKCQVYFLNTNPFYDDQNMYDQKAVYRKRITERAPGRRTLPDLKPMEMDQPPEDNNDTDDETMEFEKDNKLDGKENGLNI